MQCNLNIIIIPWNQTKVTTKYNTLNYLHSYESKIWLCTIYIWPIKLITRSWVKMSGTIDKSKSLSWLSFPFMDRLSRKMIIARWSFFFRNLLSIIIRLDIFKGAKKVFKLMNETYSFQNEYFPYHNYLTKRFE